jgi:hypothetical protein
MRRTLSRSTLALLATASLATSSAAVAQEQNPPEQSTPEQPIQMQSAQQSAQQNQGLQAGQVPAVMKSREVDFIYRSSVNLLSCDQLRNAVAVILREVGARDDVQVKAYECDNFIAEDPRSTSSSDSSVSGTFDRGGGSTGYDPLNRPLDRSSDRWRMSSSDRYNNNNYRRQSTPVHITVMMPTVVTPEVVDEVEKDKSRRDLISRVTGNTAAALNDPIFFAAERREITLSHDTIGLEPIDCELLEQMRLSVLRRLDIKTTGQGVSCDPRERSNFRPQLKVEALVPVGYLMPGERKKQEREQKAAERKASETPPSQ